MNTPVLINTYTAGEKIEPYRAVKFDATGNVVQATSSNDRIAGVSDGQGASAGGRVDVRRLGVTEFVLGGAVAAGAELTSNASGQGVSASTGQQCVGRADRAGAAGDVIPVFVFPIKI
jgi:hypothetical protein